MCVQGLRSTPSLHLQLSSQALLRAWSPPPPLCQVNSSQIVTPPTMVAKDCLITPNLLPNLVVKEHSICPTFNVIISIIVCTTPSQGPAGYRPPIILSSFDGKGCSPASCLPPPPTRIICNFHTSVLAGALRYSQDLGLVQYFQGSQVGKLEQVCPRLGCETCRGRGGQV